MSEVDLTHMHEDIEILKTDVAIIKHILSEEGELSETIVERLTKARKIPLSKYTKL